MEGRRPLRRIWATGERPAGGALLLAAPPSGAGTGSVPLPGGAGSTRRSAGHSRRPAARGGPPSSLRRPSAPPARTRRRGSGSLPAGWAGHRAPSLGFGPDSNTCPETLSRRLLARRLPGRCSSLPSVSTCFKAVFEPVGWGHEAGGPSGVASKLHFHRKSNPLPSKSTGGRAKNRGSQHRSPHRVPDSLLGVFALILSSAGIYGAGRVRSGGDFASRPGSQGVQRGRRRPGTSSGGLSLSRGFLCCT